MSHMAKNQSNRRASGKWPHRLRVVLPWAIVALVSAGMVARVGMGNLSAFGWGDVAVLCPVGSLETMIAAHRPILRALLSLAVFAVVVLIAGRAFCGWICPVPAIQRIKDAFSRRGSGKQETGSTPGGLCTAQRQFSEDVPINDGPRMLSESEKQLLKSFCNGTATGKRGVLDSRHIVLAGALASAALFGFPVFCLVCPVGLTFAMVLLLVRAFGFGDVTWSLLVVPMLLAIEVLAFRKWCRHLCPMAALASLLAYKGHATRPCIDDGACLETVHHAECGRCGRACDEGIDPRHPSLGASGMNECTLCMKCVDACPNGAISVRVFLLWFKS